MKAGLHRHGCLTCHKCYEDACDDPSDNRNCYQCRSGRPGLFDRLGTFTPRPCCYLHTRPPRRHKTKGFDELAIYRLSPTIPWWICDHCKGTFPIRKPRMENT